MLHRVTLDEQTHGWIADPGICEPVPAEVEAGYAILAELKARWNLVGYEFRLFGRPLSECWNDDMRQGFRERMAEEMAEAIVPASAGTDQQQDDEYDDWMMYCYYYDEDEPGYDQEELR